LESLIAAADDGNAIFFVGTTLVAVADALAQKF
jgi:hypothetical protein